MWREERQMEEALGSHLGGAAESYWMEMFISNNFLTVS